MSSSNHLSGQFSNHDPESYQLSLFYQAKDLMKMPTLESYSGGTLENDHILREEKLNEGHMDWDDYDDTHGIDYSSGIDPDQDSLYDSIAKHGVKAPVRISLREQDGKFQPVLSNGNHRVVIANDINPDMYIIPKYGDSVSAWDTYNPNTWRWNSSNNSSRRS